MFKQILVVLALMSLILAGCSNQKASTPQTPVTPETPTPVALTVQPEQPVQSVVDTSIPSEEDVLIGEII